MYTKKGEILLLGRFGFRSRESGSVVLLSFPQKHARQLLAYLALNAGQHSRRRLAALLWPGKENEPKKTLASLRVTLSQIREANPALKGALLTEGEFISLGSLTSDVKRFENLLRGKEPDRERSLVEAVSLYKDHLLPGWKYVVEDEQPSLEERREELRHRCAEACAELMRLYQRRGDIGLAQTFATRIINLIDPEENADWHGAARTILAMSARRRVGANGHSVQEWTLHIPPLIGRQAELAALQTWIQDTAAVHLFTLTGRGGVGKTRIAQAFAEMESREQNRCVGVVALSAWKRPDTLLKYIVECLFPQASQDSESVSMLRHFSKEGAQPALLILDTLEHLLPSQRQEVSIVAQQLRHVLQAVPNLRVLVTSQTRVGVPEEEVCHIRSLTFPSAQNCATNRVAQTESVQLFQQAASRGKTALHLNSSNAPVIAAICRLLHGHPLSIRLAAAQYPSLSLTAILEQIESNPALLRQRHKGVKEKDARHLSLEEVIRWSFQRLSCQEQVAYLSLAVFCGGFTEAAVAGVYGVQVTAYLQDWEQRALLEAFSSDCDSAGRYHVLDSLRSFAVKELGEEAHDRFLRQYAEYFTVFAEQEANCLRGPNAFHALRTVRADYLNFSRALRVLQAAASWEMLARSICALSFFAASVAGLYDLLRPFVGEALLHREHLSSGVLARLLIATGRLAENTAEPIYKEHLEEAVQIAEEVKEPLLLIEAYGGYAYLPPEPETQDLSEDRARRASEMAEQADHGYFTAAMYHRLGSLARGRGNLKRSITFYRKALSSAEEGNPLQRIVTLNALASVLSEWAIVEVDPLRRREKCLEAIACGEQAYELAESFDLHLICATVAASLHTSLWLTGETKKLRRFGTRAQAHLRFAGGHKITEGLVHRTCSTACWLTQKFAQAARHLLLALDCHENAEMRHQAESMAMASHLALSLDEAADAARLFGWAIALCPEAETHFESRLQCDPLFAPALATFGCDVWESLVHAGRSVSRPAALAACRVYLQKIISAPVSPSE